MLKTKQIDQEVRFHIARDVMHIPKTLSLPARAQLAINSITRAVNFFMAGRYVLHPRTSRAVVHGSENPSQQIVIFFV